MRRASVFNELIKETKITNEDSAVKYLRSLPGYNFESDKGTETSLELHGYLQMMLTKFFEDFSIKNKIIENKLFYLK